MFVIRFEQELLSEQPPVKRPVLSAQTFKQASQQIEHTLSQQPVTMPVHPTVHSQSGGPAPNPFIPRQLSHHPPTAHAQPHPAVHIPQQLPPPPMPPVPPVPPTMMYTDPNMMIAPAIAPMPAMGVPIQGAVPTIPLPAMPMVPLAVPPSMGDSTTAAVAPIGQAITPAEQKEWDSTYVQPDAEGKEKKKKDKKHLRVAGGQVWEDNTLADWDQGNVWVYIMYRT